MKMSSAECAGDVSDMDSSADSSAAMIDEDFLNPSTIDDDLLLLPELDALVMSSFSVILHRSSLSLPLSPRIFALLLSLLH